MGVLGYSTTAGSNTNALSGVGSIAEGVMPIKQINDAIRQELADIAQLYGDVVSGITTTGTSSAYVAATASGHTAYNNQMALRLRFHVDCAGGATTINVNVLGTKALKVFDSAGVRDPVAGEIKADMACDCVYVTALNCMVVTGQGLPTISAFARTLLDDADAAAVRTTIGAQASDPDLAAIAALGSTGIAVRTAADTWAQRQITSTGGTVTITNPAGVAGDINLEAAGSGASAATAASSGTAVDIGSIPAWATRVWVMFEAVSLNGTDDLLVQIGDSGGIENTGYVSGSRETAASSTAGFIMFLGNATRAATGVMHLVKGAGNQWFESHNIYSPTISSGGGGSKTLSDVLDRIRILPSGGNSFDGSGFVTVRWA